MIGAFRNFAKTKFAGILVFIMIIPFVFWGMGSMFSSGNTNSIVKINETNISTEEFIDYLNNSGIPQDTIRENLNDNIIEELLSGLISTKILDLEIEEYDLIISKETLLKMIKKNKSFILSLVFCLCITSLSKAIEPDVFVQSTVNRASQILSKNISKEEKINQLKPNYKEVLKYRYFDDLSIKEISKKLDQPISTIKIKIFRAKKLLIEKIKNND